MVSTDVTLEELQQTLRPGEGYLKLATLDGATFASPVPTSDRSMTSSIQ